MEKDDLLITIGFGLEMILFMVAGVSFFIEPFIGFIFLVSGIGVAYLVGKRIVKQTENKILKEIKDGAV